MNTTEQVNKNTTFCSRWNFAKFHVEQKKVLYLRTAEFSPQHLSPIYHMFCSLSFATVTGLSRSNDGLEQRFASSDGGAGRHDRAGADFAVVRRVDGGRS